ncbi:hypothetical protein JOD17_000214 [Geomicrobium sediminis]|uniref:Uncharacterized protein n=1 Tax=Geomicrobium sediminis TaxID=1347788 RepID=A0ABS2P8H9_9BACL|nr:hypothetical protein [Geomicrobium sediminis]
MSKAVEIKQFNSSLNYCNCCDMDEVEPPVFMITFYHGNSGVSIRLCHDHLDELRVRSNIVLGQVHCES